MKQSLDLRLGQHLTITPQLQQAIRLLQLSSVELQQEIQEALETNPLLEEGEDEGPESREEDGAEERAAAEAADPPGEADEPEAPEVEMDSATLAEEGATEADWEEEFAQPVTASTRADDEDLPDIDARNSPPQTLRDHLLCRCT